MKIAGSNVVLSAASEKKRVYQKTQNIEYWVDKPAQAGTEGAKGNTAAPEEEPAFLLDLEESGGKERVECYKGASAAIEPGFGHLKIFDGDRALMVALQKMIEAILGRRFKFRFLRSEDFMQSGKQEAWQARFSEAMGRAKPAAVSQKDGWGLIANTREFYYERDAMQFSAQGSVQTADGRSISFSVDLSMSREFATMHSSTLRAGDAVLRDPLVVNFDAANAGLSQTKFSFDLDADGESDQISRLLSGSGFLALDKNGDGAINDGNELFGTQSGDGFADLSAYDSDGNLWIDENDPIYDKLRIWTTDEAGNSRLLALGEKGVGAIYLGNVETAFGFRNSATNATNGELRRTGIFLGEDGGAGTVQHIDFAL